MGSLNHPLHTIIWLNKGKLFSLGCHPSKYLIYIQPQYMKNDIDHLWYAVPYIHSFGWMCFEAPALYFNFHTFFSFWFKFLRGTIFSTVSSIDINSVMAHGKHNGKHERIGVQRVPTANISIWTVLGVGYFALHRYFTGHRLQRYNIFQ